MGPIGLDLLSLEDGVNKFGVSRALKLGPIDLDFLTFANGADRLSRNVGKELQLHTA
jgi:hypothetical protein